MTHLRSVLFALILVSASARADAACTGSSPTWTSTADVASVQGCIDSAAVSGDTITVTSGSSTWATHLSVTGKALTITGGSGGTTTITCNTVTTNCVDLTVSASTYVRLSGFSWVIQNIGTSNPIIFVHGTQADVAARIDTHTFNDNGVASGTRFIYWQDVYGLIDHNTFTRTAANVQSIEVHGGSDGSDLGYASWARAFSPGTNNAVYIEDNQFIHTQFGETALDQYGGARVVARFNNFTGTAVGNHGLDSGGRRSAFSFENYGNAFTNATGSAYIPDYIRGGTNLTFYNTYGGVDGYTSPNLVMYRATCAVISCDTQCWQLVDGTAYDIRSNGHGVLVNDNCTGAPITYGTVERFSLANPDTTCTGSTSGDCNRPLDGTGTNGYPGRDQPGYSHDQVLTPIYMWNNGGKSLVLNQIGGNSPLYLAGTHLEFWVLADREYYNPASAIQSNATTPFNGTTGTGWGTLANRPTTCTTGVGYFANDQGSWNQSASNPYGVQFSGADGLLYKCTSSNIWTLYYTPFCYPYTSYVGSVCGSSSPSTGPTRVRVKP